MAHKEKCMQMTVRNTLEELHIVLLDELESLLCTEGPAAAASPVN